MAQVEQGYVAVAARPVGKVKGASLDYEALVKALPTDAHEPTFDELQAFVESAQRDGLTLLIPKLQATNYLTKSTVGRLVLSVTPTVASTSSAALHDVELTYHQTIQLGEPADNAKVLPRSMLFALDPTTGRAVNAAGVRSLLLAPEPQGGGRKRRVDEVDDAHAATAEVSSLKGEVAALKDTVTVLVQQSATTSKMLLKAVRHHVKLAKTVDTLTARIERADKKKKKAKAAAKAAKRKHDSSSDSSDSSDSASASDSDSDSN